MPTAAAAAAATPHNSCQNLVLGMGRDDGMDLSNSNYMLDGSIISHILTRWPVNYTAMTDEQRVAWLVEDILARLSATDDGAGAQPATGGARKPLFLNAMALSWAYAPTQIAEVMRRLPGQFEVVSLTRFLDLVRMVEEGSDQV